MLFIVEDANHMRDVHVLNQILCICQELFLNGPDSCRVLDGLRAPRIGIAKAGE